MPLSPGQILDNRYRVVKLLGQGGFGAVYRVWDTRLEHPRALKENLDTSPEAQRQFKREAQILTSLSHPNLPKVIDHFVVPGQGQYLVMDYVEGEDLESMLQKAGGPLPESQVLQWASQVCDALEYLHSQHPSIIHRDIKPANIKITPQGKAMLVDFGIAKVYDPNLSTTAGARAVTPGYSPQEQYGTGTTDARTDIYALGATLYHLLTNKQPVESVQRTMGIALDMPTNLNPTLSPKVEAAILKAMEPLPSSRFKSMADFRQTLFGSVSNDPQQTQAQTLVIKDTITPVISVSPVSTMAQVALKPFPWKWLGAMVTLAVVALLVYIFSGLIGGYEHSRVTSSPIAVLVETTVVSILVSDTAYPTTAPTATAISTPTPLPPTVTPTETPIPSPTSLPERIVDGKDVEMVLIPAGKFEMGLSVNIAMAECEKLYIGGTCQLAWFTDEEPAHQISLDDFYIDLTEVTNKMYGLCVQTGDCTQPHEKGSYSRSSYYGDPKYENYPVIYVDWNQAKTYCEWRGAQLPTEAQWEKAARGVDRRIYPWGNTFDGVLTNYCDKNCDQVWANKNYDDGYFDTAPVGSYLKGASPYGILDMAGNVWEWVWDWYQANYYSSISNIMNPFGPDTGEGHVMKGGAWCSYPPDTHSANRKTQPEEYADFLGFRCARSP